MQTQHKSNANKAIKMFTAFLLLVSSITACKEDENPLPELPIPTMDNIELGLGDAGVGIIAQDFHFNASIVAAGKIEKVEIKILQKEEETYSEIWEHEIIWDEYKDLKNATVHKHFTIPENAIEGKYDFIITVYDQNGSKLERKRDIAIYSAANIPVEPKITQLSLKKNGQSIFDLHGMNENPTENFSKGDTLTSHVDISFVKGDGIVYLLLIKKSANHNPTTIEEIDFSQAIVYDMYEHKNQTSVFNFSNFLIDLTTNPFTVIKRIPGFGIGTEKDNRIPVAGAISGDKAWGSGEYNLVVIYKNTTYNKTVSKSVPFNIVYN